jgi:hypothetical protein
MYLTSRAAPQQGHSSIQGKFYCPDLPHQNVRSRGLRGGINCCYICDSYNKSTTTHEASADGVIK